MRGKTKGRRPKELGRGQLRLITLDTANHGQLRLITGYRGGGRVVAKFVVYRPFEPKNSIPGAHGPEPNPAGSN